MNRERMLYVYLGYIFVFYAGALLSVKFLGIGAVEALGIGTVGGVFVGGFKDMWHFLWRKAGPRE